jgi:hypothetical protein
MKKIKLFLASSSELKEDREHFEIFIYRKSKAWFDKGIFLDLNIWEDFLDAMSTDGLQSEYNKAVADSDIFVLLVQNKVGKFTAEEFENAFGQFKENHKPFIFTYFKTPNTQNRKDLQSRKAFEDKLKNLKHYKTVYENIEGLREHFGNQLDKLADSGFMKLKAAPAEESNEKPETPTLITKTNTIKSKGKGNVIIQDVTGGDIKINYGIAKSAVSSIKNRSYDRK